MGQHIQIKRNVINHINNIKGKIHMNVSIHTGKVFHRIQLFFMIKKKTSNKLGTEETYLNTIEAIYGKFTANIIFNHEMLKSYSITSGTRHTCPLFAFTQQSTGGPNQKLGKK